MKSQVNALLHVLAGCHTDIRLAYPELKESLSRDYERIALLSKDRGLGLFGLDLPHLESLLLEGLEVGRLRLEGPLSQRVSKRVKVPRLYSGLWLRIFDYDSCLKHEVDVTALFFLRQVLTLGKKIEVECSYDRIQAAVGAYHDIERGLRRPSLDWSGDDLGLNFTACVREDRGREVHPGDCHPYGGDLFPSDLLVGSSSNEEPQLGQEEGCGPVYVAPMSLHIVQALDGHLDNLSKSLPLFHTGSVGTDEERAQRREDVRLLNKIQEVADLIFSTFDVLDPIAFSDYLEERGLGIGFKHGPGAVAERKKNWEKSQFCNWPHKLQATFPFELCGKTAGSDVERPLNHERASRLIEVPKTTKGPRLIAAEPASHQWCQQLILRFLFDQCRKHFGTSFIDFKDQTKSGDLVLRASLDKALATVDLSDASDRLTCWTVERLFRRNPSILIALHAARTRYIQDEISEYPDFLSLRKFASQGTATTFPVMSLVMLCIALGSTLDGSVTWHNLRKLRTQVRVFGDDIIIPAHGYGRLVRAMELLQLKVNVAKSYVSGHFRESCGVDGYLGYDVTPVKPKTLVVDSPVSCQAVVDNSNNLFLKGLWNASTACFELIPARLRRGFRIVDEGDTGFRGLTSYSGGDERHLAKRWNTRLHRWEVRVWGLLPQSRKRPRDGFSALLDFIASEHNHEHARIVSQYADVRSTRGGAQWEPANHHAVILDGHGTKRPEGVRSDESQGRAQQDWPVHHRLFDVGTGRRFRTTVHRESDSR